MCRMKMGKLKVVGGYGETCQKGGFRRYSKIQRGGQGD